MFWFALFPVVLNAVVEIPLTRQSALMSATSLLRHLDEVDLTNYQGTLYTGPVTIGSATYQVQIDTGSSDLWVSCYYYNQNTCTSNCPIGSTTIQYGSGSICVQPSSANVQFGELSLSNYAFGVAYGSNVIPESPDSLVIGSSQGILGLAYSTIATIPQSTQQLIDTMNNFSLYLTPKQSQSGSILTINGVYSAIVEQNGLEAVRLPLKERQHWTIGLSSFIPDGNTQFGACRSPVRGSCNAIVDSGTTFLAAPETIFQTFVNTYLNGCWFNSNGYYVCAKETKLPQLVFGLVTETGTESFILNSWDYSRVYSSDQIVVQLQQAPGGSVADSWILGDIFLKVYYSTYVVNEAVLFYCKTGECKGGENLLEFPSNGLKPWQIVVISIGGAAILVTIGLGVYYCVQNKKRKCASQNAMRQQLSSLS